MESYERRLATLTESIEKFRLYATLLEKRYDRGLATVLSLRQARRLLAQAEAGLPALRQNLGLVQQKLAVLTGSYPTTTPARSQPEDYYRQLPPVPPGLPSELLCRRPDVRAAEAALMAAQRQDRRGQGQSVPLHFPDRRLRVCQRRTRPAFTAGKRIMEYRPGTGAAGIQRR